MGNADLYPPESLPCTLIGPVGVSKRRMKKTRNARENVVMVALTLRVYDVPFTVYTEDAVSQSPAGDDIRW